MNKFNNPIVHELAIEYVFKTFNFNTESPEDLIKFYTKTYNEILSALEELDKLNEDDLIYSPEN